MMLWDMREEEYEAFAVVTVFQVSGRDTRKREEEERTGSEREAEESRGDELWFRRV